MKGPSIDSCIRYSYYNANATVANLKRGLNNADFTWSCEACAPGYWLVEDDTSTTETDTPKRRTCAQNKESVAATTLCFYSMVYPDGTTDTRFSMK